jgi:two-component system, cell cycle response regulator
MVPGRSVVKGCREECMNDAVKKIDGRILLVEDEDLLRWAVKSFLEARGLTVTEAKNGQQAFWKLTDDHFDIVITDLALQGGNGLDLAAWVTQNRPETQIIIITGQGSKESAITALRHGVFNYFEKPFSFEVLFINVQKALDKIGMMKELVRLSRTDGLTGLFNQRHFYEVLEQEIARARRQKRHLSLILADVDSFKEYNDRFGHLMGDDILARIARCLREACRRDTDKAFRYGGDEFIIILPEADLPAALEVSGRIRDMIHGLALEGISLSVGVAELIDGQDVKTFIRHADEAMYLAKQMGGDRAIVFSK